jgi:hypothetical protein
MLSPVGVNLITAYSLDPAKNAKIAIMIIVAEWGKKSNFLHEKTAGRILGRRFYSLPLVSCYSLFSFNTLK